VWAPGGRAPPPPPKGSSCRWRDSCTICRSALSGNPSFDRNLGVTNLSIHPPPPRCSRRPSRNFRTRNPAARCQRFRNRHDPSSCFRSDGSLRPPCSLEFHMSSPVGLHDCPANRMGKRARSSHTFLCQTCCRTRCLHSSPVRRSATAISEARHKRFCMANKAHSLPTWQRRSQRRFGQTFRRRKSTILLQKSAYAGLLTILVQLDFIKESGYGCALPRQVPAAAIPAPGYYSGHSASVLAVACGTLGPSTCAARCCARCSTGGGACSQRF